MKRAERSSAHKYHSVVSFRGDSISKTNKLTTSKQNPTATFLNGPQNQNNQKLTEKTPTHRMKMAMWHEKMKERVSQYL